MKETKETLRIKVKTEKMNDFEIIPCPYCKLINKRHSDCFNFNNSEFASRKRANSTNVYEQIRPRNILQAADITPPDLSKLSNGPPPSPGPYKKTVSIIIG